ncbi:hypothetical protein GCM10020358_13200 [Amorphoplanes nipponensis]|uniref:CBM2 domain-containing protein n=1 Tax=Actinoplanes nipponensis TaxID=135950 RepID=A0A919MUV7_9ACTN|nr:cellulose binding domain-containing protein [Actinoplanes nipponensis]GIE50540.1 hypothetical protein Ani05nite_40740 [Actinoplanes nipponensis]
MRDTGRDHQRQGPARTGQTLREVLPWVPTALGVGALIMLLIVAATRFSSAPEVRAVPPARPFPAQQFPIGPEPAPSGSATSAASAPPAAATTGARPDRRIRPATTTTSPRAERPSTRPTSAAPPAGPVRGAYRVVDSFDDAFIGEVLVTNAGARDSDWRVELRFPAAVGDLITSWVESAPQATLRRAGDSYVWTSGVPVPARGQVALRFHFSRSGSGNRPDACTVNGSACAGT